MPKPRARRKPHTGSIFPKTLENGSTRWVAAVTIRRPDGTRRYVTRWRRSYDAARFALDALMDTLDLRGDPRDHATPLEDHLTAWLRDMKPSLGPLTWESYERHVRIHIAPLLGRIPIGQLRPDDVRRLIRDRLAADKAPATVRLTATVLGQALRQAVSDGLIDRNPVTGVSLPRIDRAPILALTPKRAREIVAAVRGDPLEPLWLLLLGSGLRRGEALGLDWTDVDLDRATVSVRAGKTRASLRTVPIPAFVVTALRVTRGISGPVFVGRYGRLTGSEASHAWPKVLKAAGLPVMRIHDLRHGTATLMLQSGTPMRVIADQLGHANPETTARVYAHVVEAQQRAAVNGLDDVVG